MMTAVGVQLASDGVDNALDLMGLLLEALSGMALAVVVGSLGDVLDGVEDLFVVITDLAIETVETVLIAKLILTP